MKTYQCHKRVKAAQITGVSPVWLTEEALPSERVTLHIGEETFDAPPSMFSRYWPEAGDYLVEYEDGYRSISPKKAFEEGYHDLYVDSEILRNVYAQAWNDAVHLGIPGEDPTATIMRAREYFQYLMEPLHVKANKAAGKGAGI